MQGCATLPPSLRPGEGAGSRSFPSPGLLRFLLYKHSVLPSAPVPPYARALSEKHGAPGQKALRPNHGHCVSHRGSPEASGYTWVARAVACHLPVGGAGIRHGPQEGLALRPGTRERGVAVACALRLVPQPGKKDHPVYRMGPRGGPRRARRSGVRAHLLQRRAKDASGYLLPHQ